MGWTTEFYTEQQGQAPVEAFLDSVPPEDRARILRTVSLLEEFGLQLPFPYTSHLAGKLWELRAKAKGKQYRVVYFAHLEQRFILLHAFLKKSEKTPPSELRIAQDRLSDFLERGEGQDD